VIGLEVRHLLRGVAMAAIVAAITVAFVAVALPRAERAVGLPHGAMTAPRHARLTEARPRTPGAPSALNRAARQAGRILLDVGIALAVVAALLAAAVALIAARRLHARSRRDYGRFPLRLSMHDEAKPEDLVDMSEAIVDALRPRLGQRFASGQPHCALELLYDGSEWMLCLVCERARAATLEGILTQAYPDVWLGREFEGQRLPVAFPLGVPGHVLRFRKRREWMLPLSRDEERSADRRRRPSSAIEGIARAQVAAGSASVVRLQLVPMAEGFERRIAQRLSRWQRRMLDRSAPRTGPSHQPQRGSLTQSEQQQVASAVEVQDRSLLFLEVQVGAADWAAANAIASSVMAKRGENHLHRRYLRVRQRLYRQRFPDAVPPWLPPLSGRTIASSAEVAFLLELPSARMKSVPVRRITRPRIPRPPDAYKPPAALEQPPAVGDQSPQEGEQPPAPGDQPAATPVATPPARREAT
jgi:hypothetical protein